MITTLFLCILFPLVGGSGIVHHEDGTIACSSRFEYRKEMLKYFTGCEDVIKHNKLCAEEITVAYSLHPPYVFHDKNGSVIGILPDFIRYALESCCYGCNSVKFIGPYGSLEKLEQNATLTIPIQTSTKNKLYFGHSFIHMIEVRAVSFLGPAMKHDPNKMVMTIFSAVLNTWPLFVIAFAMAICSGVIIWLLDSDSNRDEFPNSFPKGPFEGFWWAIVSMTTVGYGDRAPKSTLARIFAVLWIVTGITLFSMYSASLTSSLTSAVIASHDFSLYQKNIAVLNTSTVGVKAVVGVNGNYKAYGTLTEIGEAIYKNAVDIVALDEIIANFFVDDLISDGLHDLSLYNRVTMTGSSYGMLSFNNNFTQLFKTFFESNDDQRDIMLNTAMKDHNHVTELKSNTVEANEFFTSMKMFTQSLVALIIITIILVVLGVVKMKFNRTNTCRRRTTKGDDEIPMTQVMEDEDKLLLIADDIFKKLKQRIKKGE
ncbi:uncharacterized protein LOC130621403 [Hydractinia symbiolongicarpus]|uniref:uncharacterized protein LOC130621403 n=1 Tax=Hydractinia symbiolongicarpus TaxID=13093 RepID=UPI00254F7F78|nr:uncharacterized protein LOC130621403 [Hydractinia symbiolongicarpus]